MHKKIPPFWGLTIPALLLCLCLLPGCREPENTVPSGQDTSASQETETSPLLTGWQTANEKHFFYQADGTAAVGWQTVQGLLRYFHSDGALASGWTQIGEDRYFFDPEGCPVTGWYQEGDAQYYFSSEGIMTTGWLTLPEGDYYFQEDGSMAVGQVIIDGQAHYFTPKGVSVLLVNPWNSMPEDYTANLLPIQDDQMVDWTCQAALNQMLSDCAAAGFDCFVCSSYRSQWDQEYLYNKKVQYYLDLEYEEAEARALAATSVAIPGTSEHQLGLAVDLIDRDHPILDHTQAQTGTQKWLMEHCWEYGFILRYPEGSSEITGIIYEPWHYRYVGVDIALEIRELGVTLEEYLGFQCKG